MDGCRTDCLLSGPSEPTALTTSEFPALADLRLAWLLLLFCASTRDHSCKQPSSACFPKTPLLSGPGTCRSALEGSVCDFADCSKLLKYPAVTWWDAIFGMTSENES